MSDTLSQMAAKVSRNAKIPQNGSAPALNALVDIKQYINQRAKSVWQRRVFSEYIILGTYSIPANVKTVALSAITVETGFGVAANGYGATFAIVGGVREGDNPIIPEDIGAINSVDPGLWGSTLSPIRFMPRGQNGIYFFGSYSAATTLSFWGKASFRDLTDSETWCLGDSDALIDGATADMYTNWWEDQNTAQKYETKFENGIRLLVDAQEVQGASKRRIIPKMSMGMTGSVDFSSKTGIIR